MVSDAGTGLDPGRVAQLRVERASGSWRGSGYRVTDQAVLTAAHVVAEASSVQVVFNADLPDEWSAPAIIAVSAPAPADVAVLTIDPPMHRRGVAPAPFGQFGHVAAKLPCRAVGFPLFKLRT